MEQPKKQEQLMSNSLVALRQGLEQTSLPAVDNQSVSVYKGSLTPKCLVENSARVRKAFPALHPGFFEIFTQMVKLNDFCDERLTDAVNHVIANCVYPTPTIAQFLTWDRRFDVLNFDGMLKKVNEFGGDENAGKIFAQQYTSIQFHDREKPVWVHVNDVKMYNIKSEE